MTRFLTTVLLLSVVPALMAGRGPQALGAGSPGGSLLTQNFNGPGAWPQLAALSSAEGVTATAGVTTVGTVDEAGSTRPSGAVLLTVGARPVAGQ